MPDALDAQIETFEALLPSIRRKHGHVWALIAHKTLISTFPNFSDAAQYAREKLSQEQVLIRHTDEQAESAPFVHIEE